MSSLLEKINNGTVLVADGAMGTMLQKEGLPPGDCPERWNIEHPDILQKIAVAYLEAGADIVQTNTFGGSPLKLAQYHLEEKTEEINTAAVHAVRRAIGQNAYLSASCGPSGRLLKPYGDTEPEEMQESFERQIRALVSAGVDMICIETMTDLTEATLAVRAAKKVAPDLPVAATMTFDATSKGFFTVMGIGIEDAVKGLLDAGADIIGSNCGNGIENMVRIAGEFRRHTSHPLLVQANAGLPVLQGDSFVYLETPQFMAEKSTLLLELGVNIIGGCCGTTPEHIAALRGAVDDFFPRQGEK